MNLTSNPAALRETNPLVHILEGDTMRGLLLLIRYVMLTSTAICILAIPFQILSV
ncbi:MAG: hypothetical protein ABGZ24_23990 [Fuerstiella sp.]